ncbi:MAG: hypothetical protein SGI71_00735 [Verrucomicrobiota bacterium]|nr:hypothetical protein [Verrucomicrobiota bacterium]
MIRWCRSYLAQPPATCWEASGFSDCDLGCRHGLQLRHIHDVWTRSFRVFHAGGMKACSRWLSEVTPPDYQINMNRTPAGVPAKIRPGHRHTN